MALPIQLFPGLQSLDLASSVYQLLTDHYGVELADASETIDAATATADVATKLALEPGAPLFAIRRVTNDRLGRPVEFSHDLFAADRTRITLRKVGARWKRAPTLR
jgi:GntR family transcriptional regulator